MMKKLFQLSPNLRAHHVFMRCVKGANFWGAGGLYLSAECGLIAS